MRLNEEKILDEVERNKRFNIKGKKFPLFIADTNVNGLGIYTDMNIPKNEIVTVFRGRVKTFNPLTEAADDHTSLMVSKTEILLADSPVLRFMNHSCDPNLRVVGTRTMKSTRKIKTGEELTFDYGAAENSNWQLEQICNCGNQSCRKIIVGIELMDDETYSMLYDTIPLKLRK